MSARDMHKPLAPYRIIEDDPRRPEVAALIRMHHEFAARHCPPESIYALDIDALRSEDITFWTAWHDDVLVGCGALRELDLRHGEVKSMKTAESHLRRGVGSHILRRIISAAQSRGYRRLSLETGSQAAFEPARRLYTNLGFVPCPAFGEYAEGSGNVFLMMELAEPERQNSGQDH